MASSDRHGGFCSGGVALLLEREGGLPLVFARGCLLAEQWDRTRPS